MMLQSLHRHRQSCLHFLKCINGSSYNVMNVFLLPPPVCVKCDMFSFTNINILIKYETRRTQLAIHIYDIFYETDTPIRSPNFNKNTVGWSKYTYVCAFRELYLFWKYCQANKNTKICLFMVYLTFFLPINVYFLAE